MGVVGIDTAYVSPLKLYSFPAWAELDQAQPLLVVINFKAKKEQNISHPPDSKGLSWAVGKFSVQETNFRCYIIMKL